MRISVDLPIDLDPNELDKNLNGSLLINGVKYPITYSCED